MGTEKEVEAAPHPWSLPRGSPEPHATHTSPAPAKLPSQDSSHLRLSLLPSIRHPRCHFLARVGSTLGTGTSLLNRMHAALTPRAQSPAVPQQVYTSRFSWDCESLQQPFVTMEAALLHGQNPQEQEKVDLTVVVTSSSVEHTARYQYGESFSLLRLSLAPSPGSRLECSSQEFETSLANVVKPISTKNTKTSWVRWCMPVISATQEAEAGESLEPGRQKLQ
ncbi:hypothetical protein AAY473_005587 [Plecturocebus cupreus]